MKKIIGSALFSLLLLPLRFMFKPVLNTLGGIAFSYLVRRSLPSFRSAPPRKRSSLSFFWGLTGVLLVLTTLIHFLAWKLHRKKKRAALEAERTQNEMHEQEESNSDEEPIHPSFMQTGQPQQIIITLEQPRQDHPGSTKIELAYQPK